MFQLPVGNGVVADGSSDEQPLRLEGVKKEDFRQLLRIMFPKCVNSHRCDIEGGAELFPFVDSHPLRLEDLSITEWSSVLRLTGLWQMDGLTKTVLETISTLKPSWENWVVLLDLSTQYHLPEVRAFAIRQLSSASAGRMLERVVWARKYRVKCWLQEGLGDLIRQREMLTDEDAEILGWKTVAKIYRARELHRNRLANTSYYRSGWDDALHQAVISKTPVDIGTEFGSELNEMEDEDHDE
jgi:hypothetical protein